MPDPIHISQFDAIATVLRSPGFDVVQFGQGHQKIAAHLGFDASEIVSAFEAVPLALRGPAHPEARKRLANIIAEATPQIEEFISDGLPALLDNLLQPGRHDVLAEFILPCADAFMTAHIGASPQMPADSIIPRALSPTIGVSKRKRLNRELGELRRQLTSQLPDMSAGDVADRMVLAILGTDALRGTLGQSLHAYFEGVSSATDPTAPPRTGVPHLPRQATSDQFINGQACPAGSLAHLDLKSFNDSGKPHERMRFFGIGAHTCLGRRMSLRLWRGIVEHLQSRKPSAQVLSYRLRRCDVFDVPEIFEIEVT